MAQKIEKPSLAEINKKIVEIKKKILLSEGQRKAAFEEYEAERKINSDQIIKLKKDIQEMTVKLRINRDAHAADKVKSMKLETVIGPLKERTMEQAIMTLDLQNIDLKKKLDLIKHRKKQRQDYLTKLANEYQALLSEKQNREVEIKIDNPFKKKMVSLQNSVHKVEMQWREAEHVRKSYKSIRSKLLDDASKFESIIRSLEEQLEQQQRDIQDLQKVNAEAAKTRSQARGALEREERTALNSGKIRDRQTADYKRMVFDRRLELEKLERRIFQSGKTTARPETADDISQTDQEEETETEDQETLLKETFDKLKEATGATSTEQVLERFKNQRDTRKRLEYLRRTSEVEKRQLETQQNKLLAEIEERKYAQEHDKDKSGDRITQIKSEIKNQQDIAAKFEKEMEDSKKVMLQICKSLYTIYTSLKEVGIKPQFIQADIENAEKIINILYSELEKIMKYLEDEESEENETENELTIEVLLPDTYNTLLRRTPTLPSQIGIPTTVGSEDEDEVPTRGFLKRQAQLIVDTKSRRKNIRVPVRK